MVAPDEPLYLYGFDEEVAPLLFYLDRDAPELSGKLGDAPPGYIIVPPKRMGAKACPRRSTFSRCSNQITATAI